MSRSLHAKDVIPADTCFYFEIVVDGIAKQFLDTLVMSLERALPDEGLGGSKSRGLGKVSVKTEVVAISTDDIDRRAGEIDVTDFSVRLLSDAVMKRDEIELSFLLASARRAYTGAYHQGSPSLPEVELVDHRVNIGRFGGWSLKDDKRRIVRPAITSGSIFRYRCKGGDRLAQSLAALEYSALGSFKPFRLGQVLVENIR